MCTEYIRYIQGTPSKKSSLTEDKPLTFHSKVKSSGYLEKPRTTMFKPKTEHLFKGVQHQEEQQDPVLWQGNRFQFIEDDLLFKKLTKISNFQIQR